MSSKKMNQRSQIKRGKTKRSEDKMDKAMGDIKKIGIISCCLVAVLLVVGILINPKESYAAGFLEQLPNSFYSGMTTENQHLISNISLPREFYGTSGNDRLSYIYCMDHRLGMMGATAENPSLAHLYEKGSSVKSNFSLEGSGRSTTYNGLIYILQNDTITGDGATDYYITQLAVWWYLDKANGFSDDYNYTSYDLSSATQSEENKYDDYGNYTLYNNLSAADKDIIATDTTYGQYVVRLVEGAVANQDNYNENLGTQDITIDTSSITYTINNDYLETSVIRPTSSNSSLESYSIKINNSIGNLEILDENNNPISSNNISASEGFKLRVPINEVQTENFKANVTVTGNFSNFYDAYVYNPNPADHSGVQLQRALLGLIEKPSAPTTIDLEAPTINVPDTNSTSYVVYGIGALIIVAGIVLIVMAKGPKNAKKK